MTASDVDSVIRQVEQLARGLDNMPDVTAANLALMYLRHLRGKAAQPAGTPA